MYLVLASPTTFLGLSFCALNVVKKLTCFFLNPEIIFGHFFHYFCVLILLKYIESMYLVFEGEWRDIVLGFSWWMCIMHCAWL